MKYFILFFGLLAVQMVTVVGESNADVIAAWRFDESSGSTAFAAVGAVNGALNGNAAFSTGGVSGGMVNMSTSGNGFVDMADNYAFDGNSTFSLVSWFRLSSGDTTGHLIAGRHQATVSSGYFNGVNDTQSGSGEVTGGGIFYQAYPNPVSGNLNLNDGGWHLMVGVHDFAGNQTRLYIDGVLRDTKSYDPFALSAGNFAVGGALNSAGSQMFGVFSGDVDEVSIWNHALNSSEVSYLFNNPGALAVPEPSGFVLLMGLAVLASQRRRNR